MIIQRFVNSSQFNRKKWTIGFLGIFVLLLWSFNTMAEGQTSEKIFEIYCNHCHKLAVAPVIWGYPATLTKSKVRKSSRTSAMPRFPLTEINEQELNELADYIQQHRLVMKETIKPDEKSADD